MSWGTSWPTKKEQNQHNNNDANHSSELALASVSCLLIERPSLALWVSPVSHSGGLTSRQCWEAWSSWQCLASEWRNRRSSNGGRRSSEHNTTCGIDRPAWEYNTTCGTDWPTWQYKVQHNVLQYYQQYSTGEHQWMVGYTIGLSWDIVCLTWAAPLWP